MSDYWAETFSEYVESDNATSLLLYSQLAALLDETLKAYPVHQNVLAVYFCDVLKLLTQTNLKYLELISGTAPSSESITAPLKSWPYVGYEEVSGNVALNDKVYGRKNAVVHSKLKKIASGVINMRRSISSDTRTVFSMISSKVVSDDLPLSLASKNSKASLISTGPDWFALPFLREQLNILRTGIREVMESANHPMSPDIINSLITRHITANCRDGESKIEYKGDYVVLGSGAEILNRMLASAALGQGLPVINVMHGEGFGVLDEPVFGRHGECTFASAILGYGDHAGENRETYEHGIPNNVKYFPSDGCKVKQIFCEEFRGVTAPSDKLKYYYFPTSLSGASHRYGPYRDTADTLYQQWQRELLNLFADKLTFKCHPKDKYLSTKDLVDTRIETNPLQKIYEEIDVFVFDYIGTAFNEACATDKPVIFFDLGIRNIHQDALREIKGRTIYFDIKDGIPSLKTVEELVAFEVKPNLYPLEYCLGGGGCTRTNSLLNGLELANER